MKFFTGGRRDILARLYRREIGLDMFHTRFLLGDQASRGVMIERVVILRVGKGRELVW
jgi:hypothetical protein